MNTKPTESKALLLIAFLQGAFFLITGLWPIVSIQTFMLVTGPKTDIWLVKTVALLIVVTGIILLMAWRRRAVSLEVMTLAIGNALALTTIDLVYVTNHTIGRIYLLDALAETILIVWWLAAWKSANSKA